MSRADIVRRVDELAEQYKGPEFADAIREYAATLDEASQEELREIVLERAASFDQAVMERVDAGGWFRRQWDKASGK
jgi:tRNA threonylcarbamoyladenosine modification (KEOPS) complex Cgi121 subunit